MTAALHTANAPYTNTVLQGKRHHKLTGPTEKKLSSCDVTTVWHSSFPLGHNTTQQQFLTVLARHAHTCSLAAAAASQIPSIQDEAPRNTGG